MVSEGGPHRSPTQSGKVGGLYGTCPCTGWTSAQSSHRPRAAVWLSDQGVRTCGNSDHRPPGGPSPVSASTLAPVPGKPAGALPVTQHPQTARAQGCDSLPVIGGTPIQRCRMNGRNELYAFIDLVDGQFRFATPSLRRAIVCAHNPGLPGAAEAHLHGRSAVLLAVGLVDQVQVINTRHRTRSDETIPKTTPTARHDYRIRVPQNHGCPWAANKSPHLFTASL